MRQRVKIVYHSANAISTQKLAARVARMLCEPRGGRSNPLVIGIIGELGAGKTTFIQGFAKALNVEEKVVSPSFVLMKIFRLAPRKRLRHLIHIDCWRLKTPNDLKELGFLSFLQDPYAIVLIEWADRIRSLLPAHTVWVSLTHAALHKRKIVVEMPKW